METYPTHQFPALPTGWVEYRAPTGQPYWYNTITRQSSWTFPFIIPEQPKQIRKKQIKKKVPGTHWLFVLTPEGHEFYYDRETKTSVWEMPKELEEPMKELFEENTKKRKPEEEEEREEKSKKTKVEEAKPTEMTEEDIMWQLEQMGANEEEQEEEEVVLEYTEPQEIEEEIKTVQEEPKKVQEKKDGISEQEKISKFNELLNERNISPFAVYSLEYPVLMTDPRFSLVPSNKQKSLFNKYCQELGSRIKNEQKNKKKPEEEFMELLASKVTEKMYFDDFRRKSKNDPRFKAIATTRERELLFKDYMKNHLANPKEGYKRLLRETKEIQPGIRWRDAKKILEDDERYQAIESKDEREDLFRDYLEMLQKE